MIHPYIAFKLITSPVNSVHRPDQRAYDGGWIRHALTSLAQAVGQRRHR